jgi:hypothetical protein
MVVLPNPVWNEYRIENTNAQFRGSSQIYSRDIAIGVCIADRGCYGVFDGEKLP